MYPMLLTLLRLYVLTVTWTIRSIAMTKSWEWNVIFANLSDCAAPV
jgi:hypothetical protein